MAIVVGIPIPLPVITTRTPAPVRPPGTFDTLLLDVPSWDLTIDAAHNIALAGYPYALAQDAASAIKTFIGEAYYDTKLGIPYFQQILGKFPSMQYMKSKFNNAALTVPGVIQAKSFISGVSGRRVTGQVQVTDATGTTSAAGF